MHPAEGVAIASRFVLEKQLGAGSYGTVWSARDLHRDRAPVAIKILHEALRDTERPQQRFRREAELLAKLDHRNVVRAIACDLESELAYIAMELAAGRTLMEELRAVAAVKNPIPPEQEIEIVAQLSEGVAYAHEHGLVHRDLKPSNVMIDRRPGSVTVKVLDFGVAKMLDANITSATTLGRRLGALFYMSPEQARGEEVDHRADIFSMGTIFFELLTLHRAWAIGEEKKRLPIDVKASPALNNADGVLTRMTRDPRPAASEFRPGLGDNVDRVLAKAMAPKPHDRFATARELMIALEEALTETLKSARPPTLLWKRPPVSLEVMSFDDDAAPPESDPAHRTAVVPQSLAGDDEVDVTPLKKTAPARPPPPAKKRKRAARWPLQLAALIIVGGGGYVLGRRATDEPPIVIAPREPEATPIAPRPGVQPRERVEEAEVVRTPPTASPAPLPAKKPAKIAEAAPPPRAPAADELDPLLARAKNGDASALSDLKRRIVDAAKSLEEGPLRTSIERRAITAGAVGDANALEACVKDLRAARRP